MNRLHLAVLLGLALFSLANAQDFVLYDNPFVSGLFPEVAPDGGLWFWAGKGSVVSFDSSTGVHIGHRVKPSDSIVGLTIDAEGGVWTATSYRVDHIYQGRIEIHEFEQRTAAIAAAPDGSIWLSIGGDKLLRFDDGSWQPVAGCPDRCPSAMCFEPDGTGWFLCPNRWLARYRDGEWTLFEENITARHLVDMAVGELGELWVTDDACVRRYQDGLLADQWDQSSGPEMPTCVDVDPQGHVWVGTYFSGVSMFDGQDWTTFNTLNSGLPSDNIRGVAASPNGTVFFCTTEGIASYNNGFWSTYRGDTVMNNDIWSVGVNDQGLVFYGTGYGQIGYFEAPNWEVLYRPEGQGVNDVCDIAFDHTSGIWFAQEDMVRVWRGAFINYSRAGSDGIYLTYCKSLCCDNDGNIWVCALKGLARYDGSSWTSWETDSANGIRPESITCDHEGKVWVGLPIGLGVFSGQDLVNWLPEYCNVKAMTCDNDGVLWFGFEDRGLLEFDGENEIAWFTVDDGLPSNGMVCIECDPANHIWVGTNDGLGYFDRTQLIKWDIDSGLPVNEIRDIFAAPNGDVWFATPCGLLCRESGIEPPKPSITIATDLELYQAGDTMTVTLSYENPGLDVFIDIQVACQLPDGSLFYYPGGNTPVPFISGMLPAGTVIPMVIALIYDFPTDFTTGDYIWMTAMFEQGTFNMITDIATAPFTFE